MFPTLKERTLPQLRRAAKSAPGLPWTLSSTCKADSLLSVTSLDGARLFPNSLPEQGQNGHHDGNNEESYDYAGEERIGQSAQS